MLLGELISEVGFLQRSVFTFGAKTTPASGKILRRRARGGTVTLLRGGRGLLRGRESGYGAQCFDRGSWRASGLRSRRRGSIIRSRTAGTRGIR